MEQKVTITNKVGEKLSGLYSKGRKGAIVLVHGFGVTKEERGLFDQLAKFLSDENYSTYRFDFSGRGESQGDYVATSLTKQKDDLESILKSVKEKKVALLTQSFGGPVAIALSPKVKAIAMLGSFAEPKKVLGKLFAEGYKPDSVSTVTRSNGEVIRVGPNFWKDLDSYDLVKKVAKLKVPILFIHGAKDDKVPLEQVEKLFSSAKPPKSLVIIGGASHNPSSNSKHMHELKLKLKEWFKDWL